MSSDVEKRMSDDDVERGVDVYLGPTHQKLRVYLRQWFQRDGRRATLERWEGANHPDEVGRAAYAEMKLAFGSCGLLALFPGPGAHLARVARPNMFTECGIDPLKVDVFHLVVASEERSRLNVQGAIEGVLAGTMIGLSPILKFGQPWLSQGALVEDFLAGRKHLCLAVTEPQAGSDVARVTTTAVRSSDGSHYIVNGTKKWITGAYYATHFTTLVRTGESSLSMLLIERSERIHMRYVPTTWGGAGMTGLVSFEGAVVPVANLLGAEGDGLKITLSNFNFERLNICGNVIGVSRRVIDDTLERLAVRPDLWRSSSLARDRLADALSELARVDAWFYKVCHKYHVNAGRQAQLDALGGETALLKLRVTRASRVVAERLREILGYESSPASAAPGVFRFSIQDKILAVGGGSEEIMADLGVRQALRSWPHNHRL